MSEVCHLGLLSVTCTVQVRAPTCRSNRTHQRSKYRQSGGWFCCRLFPLVFRAQRESLSSSLSDEQGVECSADRPRSGSQAFVWAEARLFCCSIEVCAHAGQVSSSHEFFPTKVPSWRHSHRTSAAGECCLLLVSYPRYRAVTFSTDLWIVCACSLIRATEEDESSC